MKNRLPVAPFAPNEIRSFIAPLTLASLFVMAYLVLDIFMTQPAYKLYLIVYGLAGIIYIIVSNILIVRLIAYRDLYGTINALMVSIGLGLLSLILPQDLSEVRHILIVFSITAIATISGRKDAYIAMATVLMISLPVSLHDFIGIGSIRDYVTPLVVSVIMLEAIVRIKNTTLQHIHRLETINNVSRRIMQSLDAREILSLLDAAIRDTLIADTYFIGFQDSDNIRFDLFHDDGEYFNGISVPIKGTLSSWVIKNQKELFLPDLREDVELEGVEHYIIGKEKTNLSWMGVPLKAENLTGILVLASYSANAFDRADLELLISLGQHVTLALDNAIRHEQVEKQARLDSLTGVYNHGYFLNVLAEQANQSLISNKPLSVIMLDIDYFKQYNDIYGHLVGDHILEALCTAVKQHIKQNDAVGRWGGEEFVISLPYATGAQAIQIAKRIGETLGKVRVEDRNQNTVPIPTISQGIAVYPNDANEIYRLIDAADRRLYVAKERGRNQIEPETDIWQEP